MKDDRKKIKDAELTNARIISIDIWHSELLDCIRASYADEGKAAPIVEGYPHLIDGEEVPKRTPEQHIKLSANEHLVALVFRKCKRNNSVRLVTFDNTHMTAKVYGPYGQDADDYVLKGANAGVVTSFSSSGSSADNFSVACITKNEIVFTQLAAPDKKENKVGSYGGTEFDDYQKNNADNKVIGGINKISISTGRELDSITFDYLAVDGSPINGERHGGDGGTVRTLEVGKDARLLAVWGRYAKRIDSISFLVINKNWTVTSLLCDLSGGENAFQFSLYHGHDLVALHGRSDRSVDAIGFWVGGSK